MKKSIGWIDCMSWNNPGKRNKKMIRVYRIVGVGQSGNEGVDCEQVGEFETMEDAKRFCESRTDTNGWVDYRIVPGDEDE